MKNYLLSLLALILFSSVSAQDPVLTPPDLSSIGEFDTVPNDSLIITEAYIRSHRLAGVPASDLRQRWSYLEFTNVSKRPIHMDRYFYRGKGIGNSIEFYTNRNKMNFHGIVQPGESYLFVIPYPTEGVFQKPDGSPLYPNGLHANKEILDMSDTLSDWTQHQNSWDVMLYNRYRNPESGNIDSAYVDCFGNGGGSTNKQVAGVPSANNNRSAWDWVWVRKTVIKSGNWDWESARGTDLKDSEWMPIPKDMMYEYTDQAFTTVKHHGNADTVNFFTSLISGVELDMDALTITLPYGVRRDSVFRSFEITPNIGWNLQLNGDTSQYFMQTADTIEFYFAGENLLVKRFHVIVSTELDDKAFMRPLVYNVGRSKWEKKWDVSTTAEVDSIGPLPFATPVDSFIKYTRFDGDMEIIFANGKSSELKNGDMIKITSPDKSTSKTYKVSVEPYIPSIDSKLSTVIFPGLELWENPMTFEFVDTFLTFLESSLTYMIDLPEGTKSAPEILAIPRSPNASVSIIAPINLSGSVDDRTMHVKCMAESGADVTEYKFIFNVKRPVPELEYTPFFSDLWVSTGMLGYWGMQIFNPDDEAIDLSDYMLAFIHGDQTLESYMNTQLVNDTSRWVHRPTYMVTKDPEGKPVFSYDFEQTTSYLPAKTVYSISCNRAFPNYQTNLDPTHNGTRAERDRLDFYANRDGSGVFQIYSNYRTFTGVERSSTLALLKINNDSILEGTKAMNDIIDDYEVVDIINGFSTLGLEWKVADIVDGRDTVYKDAAVGTLYRKSNVYRGNPVDQGSFGITMDDSVVIKEGEWVAGDSEDPPNQTYRVLKVRSRYENFVMDYTDHIPYLGSYTYKISEGIVEQQSIDGVADNTTLAQFMSNIILPNENMKVVVTDASGIVKTDSEIMADGDLVKSYSVRGTDSVIYAISKGVLSDDVLLTSSDYTPTLAANKETGDLSGIEFGVSFKTILEKVTPPSGATMMLVSKEDPTIQYPLTTLSTDTNLVGAEARIDLVANADAQLKVVAENGAVCLYALVFNEIAMPYVLSSVYSVSEDKKLIDNLVQASVATVISNLTASPGATIQVLDKNYGVRELGIVSFEDRIRVTQGNKSVIYQLKFIDEPGTGAGIDEALISSSVAGIDVFPNPSTGVFNLSGLEKNSKISVYAISGAKIKDVTTSNPNYILDLSNMDRGIYMLKINSNKVSSTVKIIVE